MLWHRIHEVKNDLCPETQVVLASDVVESLGQESGIGVVKPHDNTGDLPSFGVIPMWDVGIGRME